MIKKLAIAMSLRDTGARLFELASGVASSTGAELIVVSILRTKDVDGVGNLASFGYPVSARDYAGKVFGQRMANLQKIAGRVSFPENRFKTIFRVGDPVSEFVKIVTSETPDMVMVGEGRRLTPEGLFRSSFTKAVLKRSPVSVTVVKKYLSARDGKGKGKLKPPGWGMP